VRRVNWKKIGTGFLGVALFILAIQLLKEGAGVIAPYVLGWLHVDNPANSLGFGWLSAYVIMSGSPVAAVALTFFDAGTIRQFEALTMISGSRLGASFIVLFVGFIYVLRGHEGLAGLSMGLLSFIVTAFLHVPGLGVSYVLLTSDLTDAIRLGGGRALTSMLDVLYGPVVRFVAQNAPGWLTFVIGAVLVLLSFNLIDRSLPQLQLESSQFGAIARVVYRPIVMFLMGLAITALSMSVSISLSILVPLSARGYIKTENAIAYVMGANVSTFVDTLFVALLLNNPLATQVVLVQMISISIISLLVLSLLYAPFERLVLHLTSQTVRSTRNLAIFAAAILITPLILLLV
jgi:sodium-dependent phosphate cotransporter